jgi:hypothetical protein
MSAAEMLKIGAQQGGATLPMFERLLEWKGGGAQKLGKRNDMSIKRKMLGASESQAKRTMKGSLGAEALKDMSSNMDEIDQRLSG